MVFFVWYSLEELRQHRGQEAGVLLVSVLRFFDLLLQAGDLLLSESGDAVEFVLLDLDLLQSPVGASVVCDPPALALLFLAGIHVAGKDELLDRVDAERFRFRFFGCLVGALVYLLIFCRFLRVWFWGV